MKITREIEITPVRIEYYFNHCCLTVFTTETGADGEERRPICSQTLVPDEYCQSLLTNLQRWIEKKLK